MKIMPVSLNSNKQVSFAGDPVKLAKKPFYSSIVKMYDEALDVFQKAEKKNDRDFAVCQIARIFDTKIQVSPQIFDRKGGRFWIENVIPGKSDFGTSQLIIYNVEKNADGAQDIKYSTLLANPCLRVNSKKIKNEDFLIMYGKEGSFEKLNQFWMTRDILKYSDNAKEVLKDIQAKLRKFLNIYSK